jgi:hypothetical protein
MATVYSTDSTSGATARRQLYFSLSPPPQSTDIEVIFNWLLQELERLTTVVNGAAQGFAEPTFNPPPKMWNGQIRFADGVGWSPGGQGRGYYGYDESIPGWRKLG